MKTPFAVFAAANKSSSRAWRELLNALATHTQLLLLWLVLASSAGSSVIPAQAAALVEFQAFPLLRYDATGAAASVTAAAAAAAGGPVGSGGAAPAAATAASPVTAAAGGNTPTLLGAWGTPSFSSSVSAARVAATVVTLQHCIVPPAPQLQQHQEQQHEGVKGKGGDFSGCRRRMQMLPMDMVLQQVASLPKKAVVLLRFEDLSVFLLDALATAGRSLVILLPRRSSSLPASSTAAAASSSLDASLDSSFSASSLAFSSPWVPSTAEARSSDSSSHSSLYRAALYAQQHLCLSAEDEQRLHAAEQQLSLRFFSGACFFAHATPELEALYSDLQQKQRLALASLLQQPTQQQLSSYNPSQPPLCPETGDATIAADRAATSADVGGKTREAESAAAARGNAVLAAARKKGPAGVVQRLFSVFDSTKAVVVQQQPHAAAANGQRQQQRTPAAGETVPLTPRGTNIYAWLLGRANEHGTAPKIIAVVTHHDAFAAAPLLAFGARENGSGVAALMELARTFAALYDRERGVGPGNYSLLFLFTDAGAADYSGALRWLKSMKPSVLESVAYVLCLDDLTMEPQASQVYLHTPKKYKDPVSRRLLHCLASSLDLAGFSLLVKPKKIALHAGAPLQLLWQHEQFTLKRLLAASLSARADAQPLWQRSSLLDTSPPSAAALQKLVAALADGLAHFVYDIPDPTVDILNIHSSSDTSSSSYAPFAPFLDAWLAQASQTSRFYAMRDADFHPLPPGSPGDAGGGDAAAALYSAEKYLQSIHQRLQQLLSAAHVQQFSLQFAGGRRFFYDPPLMLAVVESRPLGFELLLLLLAIIYALSVYFSLVGWGRCIFLLRTTIASSVCALRGTKPRLHAAQSKKLA